MRQKSLLKTMLLLCALIVGSSAWADTVTFTAGVDKSNGTSITKNNITISFSSGVFNRDDNFRCYSGASMTISSTEGNMTQIDFTATSGNPMTNFNGNPDVGAWTDNNKTQWKGNASEINFGITSGQVRITTIVVTSGPTTYTVTYNANDATSGEVPVDATAYASGATVTVLGNTGNLAKTGNAFGGWNTQADGLGTTYSANKTFNITANTTLYAKWNPYTITAQSNNSSYGTVSLEGFVITGAPAPGCRYASPAYEVFSGSATVEQNDNKFTVTPTSDCTVIINFEAIPTHTAHFSVNGTVDNNNDCTVAEDAAITFPANPADINGKKFMGWVKNAIDGTTDDEPEFVTSATMPTNDITYYAVFAAVEGESEWIETALANMTASDVFVFSNGSYAMTNDNSTANPPSASLITVELNKITSNVADNLKWNVSGNSTDGYVFYPNSSTTTWLYCNTTASSGSNNNIRVGTGDRKLWVFDNNGYLVTKDNKTARYLSLYSAQDFRGYVNTSNGAFVPKFYKYSSGSITGYCTSVGAAIAVTGVTLAPTSKDLFVGEEFDLEATVAPANATYKSVTWTSSDETKATVENGHVVAIAAGTPTITVTTTDGSFTATCNLTISNITVTGVSLNKESATIYTGSIDNTVQLTPTIAPANATIKTVSWESSDEAVATVDDNGLVTAVAEGTATITVTTIDGSFTATCAITVEIAPGSAENPYTVAQAILNTPSSGTSADVYIHGIVSAFYSSTITGDSYHRYYISDDGTTSSQLLVFNGKKRNGTTFSNEDDIRVGDIVTIVGGLTTYSSTKEVAADNYIVSHKLVSPTFSPTAGEVTSGTTVTISDLHTNATIYYTTDGTDPTESSSVYSDPIAITSATTLKAIAVKSGYTTSDVASAEYTIDLTPIISLSSYSVEATADETNGSLNVTCDNIDTSAGVEIIWYTDNTGSSTTTKPDWITTEITTTTLNYEIAANTGDARTAYFKVYGLDEGANDVYSNLVTINQARLAATYTLVSNLTPGKKYIIASGTDGSVKAMGAQTNNYRGVVGVTASNKESATTISVDVEGVSEFVVYGPDANGSYTIYDAEEGYLYASSSSDNYLNSQNTNDKNGKWSISFDDTSKAATVVAQGSNSRKNMRYNSSNSRFSCYKDGSSMAPVYFYEKADAAVSTTVEKTLNSSGYATFATTTALDFLDAEQAGYSAWQITGINGSTITFSQITNHVEAGTGILLKGTPNGNINLNILPVGGSKLTSNLLVGTTADFVIEDGKYYGLSGNTFVPVSAGTIPAGKALLPATAVPSGARLTFVFEEANGISAVESVKTMAEGYYNLQGQRIDTPKKGLYIVNGKKVIIK